MLEEIAKMAECLQPTDFENSDIDAAIIIIAKNNRISMVGGGNIAAQAQGIARIIKKGGPLFHIALMAAMEEDE